MGRAPCCEKVGLKRGRWTAEEDRILTNYIQTHGEGAWRSLPKNAGLLRCGKSCRLRWINYLRADVKRGNITPEEEEVIVKLHYAIGNRWSLIAGQLPGRTDNEIKNYWNSHLSRKIYSFKARLNASAANLVDISKLAKACKKKNNNGTIKKQHKPFPSKFPKYYNTNNNTNYNQVLLESRKGNEKDRGILALDHQQTQIRSIDDLDRESNNLLIMGPHHTYGVPTTHEQMNVITPTDILVGPTPIEPDMSAVGNGLCPITVNQKEEEPINGGFWGPPFDWQLDYILQPHPIGGGPDQGFNGGFTHERENLNLVVGQEEDKKISKFIIDDNNNNIRSTNFDQELLDWPWVGGAGKYCEDQLEFYDDETDKILYWLWGNGDPDGLHL